jgi:hypothetical protein
MAIYNAANNSSKSIGDPIAAYESIYDSWRKCRAVCTSEQMVKDYDSIISFNNLLIPFSPVMSQDQYDFYKMEAELPGICAQFARLLVGGLLRKKPIVEIPERFPKDAIDWIINRIGNDDVSLLNFLDTCLWEEVQTSRCWVYVDYPEIDSDKYEKFKIKPYPIIIEAESIINWHKTTNKEGRSVLDLIIIRGTVEKYKDGEVHPDYIDTVWKHELKDGKYQVSIYERKDPTSNVTMVSGKKVEPKNKVTFEIVDIKDNIKMKGKHLDFIPIWPLNGSIDVVRPLLSAIVDKEVSLYNKVSRRNHLLYGAATYTPIIFSDMSDEKFEELANQGLGTWLHLDRDDSADVLKTPTEALSDMEKAIAANIEEIARLGVRMLAPEIEQSGVALQLRNAAQTAQLGSLSVRLSSTFKQIIATMLEWRYNIDVEASEITFMLSTDMSSIPIGADWLRIITEWYEGGLIPRSIWLKVLKQNDIIDSDYNDEEGKIEINEDDLISKKIEADYLNKITGEV